MRFGIAILALFTLPGLFAQQFEVGVAGGGSFVRGVPVTGTTGSATAGLNSGAAFGVVGGQRLYKFLSGEVRYTYLQGDLKLTSGGVSPTFGAVSHAIHYDFLVHPYRVKSKVQPFAAFGAGVKLYRGTGTETAYQQLGQYAYMTKTQQIEPMISVGGGVRIALSPRVSLRLDFRDYITPFPKDVIAPNPHASVQGWLHDFVPLVGISAIL